MIMGTIHIKNLSSISDKTALTLAADYYNRLDEAEIAMRELKVGIKKKGHTFTIFDKEVTE